MQPLNAQDLLDHHGGADIWKALQQLIDTITGHSGGHDEVPCGGLG